MTEGSQVFSGLETWIHDYGAGAVFLLLTCESLGLPLPGESLLITTAILAGRGSISFMSLYFSALVGAVTGNFIGYVVGRKLGYSLLLRYGGKIGLTAERMQKVEKAFAQYGAVTIVFARFFIVLRQLNGVVAGTLAMDWRQFLLLNLLGSALWVLVWTVFGFYVGVHGADIAVFLHKLGILEVAVAVAVAIGIAIWAYKRRI
jgi:membrane protein DedA with SNARE-associated domain